MEKKTFKDAKEAAQRFLQECPRGYTVTAFHEPIAYRKGLTGAAAAWTVRAAVRKQKQHRVMVMIAIDVLMNPAAPVAGVAKA